MIEVLFIHSAGPQGPGEGSSRLLSSLRAHLPEGYALTAPMMPNPDSPDPGPWIAAVKIAMDGATGPFVLVGHSLGGSTILQALERLGIPHGLLGVVLLAVPFWGAPGWGYDDFALRDGASERLAPLAKVIILHGEKDEVVEADHPARYREVMPQAALRTLPGVDHEAAEAAPDLVRAITEIAGNPMVAAN